MNNKKSNEKGNVILTAVLLILIFVCIICVVVAYRKSNQEVINGGGIISGEMSGENISESNNVKHDPIRLEAYKKALSKILEDKKLIDDEVLFEDEIFKIEDNMFAICDVDLDGKEELVVSIGSAPTAGMVSVIYDYNETSGDVEKEFSSYVATTFYDNGILKVSASHNQGLAGDKLWPYSLYKYDKETNTYTLIAYVDAWDESLAGTNYEGAKYPKDVDTNGDGIVYYVMKDGVYELKNPITKANYEKWVNQYLETANEIDIPYVNLTQENIDNLK